jgi:hypothetical protein
MMNTVDLLRQVVGNIAQAPYGLGPINGEAFHASGLARARGYVGGWVGVQRAGAEALTDLTRALFEDEPRYMRGTTYQDFSNELFTVLLENHTGANPKIIGNAELIALKARLADWFAEGVSDHTLYVPCAITFQPAPPFHVGPVAFTRIEDFNFGPFDDHHIAQEEMVRVREKMDRQHAFWMVTLPVLGARGMQVYDLGDLTVDVALAVLQLAIPLDHSRYMARLCDLRGPRIRTDLSSCGAHFSASNRSSEEPGVGLAHGMLHHHLGHAATLVAAGGRHVNALATGVFELPRLQQSWCDAAYWFRQGVRDKLDSIAVTKLETAVEVLVAANNTGGNRDRQIDLIRAYYSRERDEYINPDSEITVAKFVNDLIRDRSRLLHGNWSTLASPMTVSRGQLENFARTVLATAAVQLSLYIDADGRDDISEFIAWSARRSQPTENASN